MTKEIYIGNLDFETTEEQVRRLCAPFGQVRTVSMITDRNTGRFRGFCFVEMEEAAAKVAITKLNGKVVAGRKVKVSAARPRNTTHGADKKRGKTNEQPLHERTQRGGFGPHDFPHSGGSRSRQQRQGAEGSRSNSDFPHSGGSSRRN
ncbi:MAG: RNA-binding protein [Candidatus Promineifilaceae bacterium]|nr:RNA-binding protein [Candidatus Promineifilaceae bacterium]